jgi:surface protein
MNPFKKNNSLFISSKKERLDFPHNPNNLVLVYDTSKEPANNTISVPLNGTVNCTINWGDGFSENHTTTGFKTHTYSQPGVYVVQISGTLTQFSYGTNSSSSNNRSKLVACLSFGDTGLNDLSNAFYNCQNLVKCPHFLPSSVISLRACFLGCTSFNYSISSWNTSNIKSMEEMFFGCINFNQPINTWNTSTVTNMAYMFQNCYNFNQPLFLWNTSSVTNMFSMFTNCNKFNQPIGLWDTSSVTNMVTMFSGAFEFKQDLSGWDIRQVTNMSGMFSSNSWGTSNYDAALIAWSQLVSPQTGISFGAGTNKYSSDATSARNVLTNTYNWVISDGGLL